jgi:hypothetical protein
MNEEYVPVSKLRHRASLKKLRRRLGESDA